MKGRAGSRERPESVSSGRSRDPARLRRSIMPPQRHTFATAAILVGEGECRRQGTARDVVLTVETAPPDFRPDPTIASPFLSGRIRAEGSMIEECRPGASLLGKGRQAVLKLRVEQHWSLVHILLLDLRQVTN